MPYARGSFQMSSLIASKNVRGRHQPAPGEVLHIAMDPIAKYDGNLVSLALENGEWGLVLFGYYVAGIGVMYPRALFVFVKPRYGDREN